MTAHTPLQAIGALSQQIGKTLRAFGELRARETLTADEALIFLALGHLGFRVASVGIVVRPVVCVDLAELLHIPKETVRRKLVRLESLGLVATTSRGVLVQNEDKWRQLAEKVAS